MNTRHTKQKQIVLETLQKDKTHPTIQELYDKIKLEYKNIGQATIYRNVNKLVEDNTIRKVCTLNGVDHYDGDTREHCHLLCHKCGKIVDIFEVNLEKIISSIMKNYDITIDNYNLILEGFCPSCKKEGKNEKV